MKQRNNLRCAGIQSRDVWLFVVIPREADQTEIVGLGRAAMLPGDDVIDLEGEAGREFGGSGNIRKFRRRAAKRGLEALVACLLSRYSFSWGGRAGSSGSVEPWIAEC